MELGRSPSSSTCFPPQLARGTAQTGTKGRREGGEEAGGASLLGGGWMIGPPGHQAGPGLPQGYRALGTSRAPSLLHGI